MKYVSEQFMTEPTRFWEVAPETWGLVIDTNVMGVFLMARAAVPLSLLKSLSGLGVGLAMKIATDGF
jgi:NAD(P)-dependent dehydrogenase (short-subunit alcohol dehydrogenase family)